MKHRYVVAYDYGQGAAWAVMLAESTQQILAMYPTLREFDDVPAFIDKDVADGIRAESPIDIDDPPPEWLRLMRAR